MTNSERHHGVVPGLPDDLVAGEHPGQGVVEQRRAGALLRLDRPQPRHQLRRVRHGAYGAERKESMMHMGSLEMALDSSGAGISVQRKPCRRRRLGHWSSSIVIYCRVTIEHYTASRALNDRHR